MSEDDAEKALLEVIEGFNLLGSCLADYDLKEIMELDPHERGVCAHDQMLANISNEDSS